MIDVIEISKLPLSKYKLVNAKNEIVSVGFLSEYEVSKKNYAYRLNRSTLNYQKMTTDDIIEKKSILILPN